MDSDFIVLVVVPVGVSALAVLLRGRTRLFYWSIAATLGFIGPLIAAVAMHAQSITPLQDVIVATVVFLLPALTPFGVVRSKWARNPWVAALLIGPLSFLGALLLALIVGVNLGLIRK